eukprot:CCRYP_011679-RC/>CCRYP_011679-RC protein AED:0.03 eAED:0.03 QI:164/0.83/0.85/1/0.16/0/7/2937/696
MDVCDKAAWAYLGRSSSSIISEVTSLWVTGCFHEDGLADSADGIGGGWTSEQILKIMTDTRLGTYGCAILLLYMIGKVELIAILGKSIWVLGKCQGGGPAIVVTHTLSRLVAPMMVRTRDYVDEQGPKYRFYSFFLQAKYLVTWSRVVFATMTSLIVASIAYGVVKGAILISAVMVMAFFSGRYADYLLGGVMGDYLGATICVTEVYLLTIILLFNKLEDHLILFEEIVSVFSEVTTGDTSASGLMKSLMQSDSVFSLLKAVSVVLFTHVWCRNVGHSPVFVRKAVSEREPTDEIQISLVGPVAGDDTNVSNALEAFLADKNNNFSQRFNAVREYLDSLAKPVGSLGTLEDWASRLASIQRSITPKADRVACILFAADHGVAKDIADGGMSCSAYPASVSKKIVLGLDKGLAGACVLAKCNDVDLRVIDVGLADGLSKCEWTGKIARSSKSKIIGGTKNFCTSNALSSEEVDQCIRAGKMETAKTIDELGCDVVVFGEVGIGNTTTSATLISCLTGKNPSDLCGSGASTSRDGVNEDIVTKKISIVEEAIKYHGASKLKGQPYKALKAVGGAEIAAIVGGMLEASERNVVVLVDGFICSTAAMIACLINPMVSRGLLFATESTEKGQAVALEEIAKIALANSIPPPEGPALRMKLRMGEGTGGLSAVPLARTACATLSIGTLEEVLNLEGTNGYER